MSTVEMEPARLNFELLARRVDDSERVSGDEDRDFKRLVRLVLGASIVPMSLLLVSSALPEGSAVWVRLAAVVMQWICVALFLFFSLRRLPHAFRNAHEQFAREMDDGLARRRETLAWLGQFDVQSLREHQRYVSERTRRFPRRLGLILGGVDKLGILPIIALAYVQFKDVRPGELLSLANVHSLGIVLLSALLLLYAGGWWLMRLALRLETYDEILSAAVDERERR
jgi:hypothetical protein